MWFLPGKKENQNLSKTCHSPDKCCERNNTKKELEHLLLVLGLSSCPRKNGENCDSHGGKLRRQVHEPGVRANIIPGHDRKVLQELSHCLDKTSPWLWFPRRAASKVHLEFQIGLIQGLNAKLNTREKTHFHHTHRNILVNSQDRAVTCQHLPGQDHPTEVLGTLCCKVFTCGKPSVILVFPVHFPSDSLPPAPSTW